MLSRFEAKFGITLAVMLAFGLIVASLLGINWLGVDWLSFSKNRESIDGLQSAITILAILFGAAISYFRFFAHRLFVRRATLTMNVSVHAIDAGWNWHAPEIRIVNNGSLALRIMNLYWRCTHHLKDGSAANVEGNRLHNPNLVNGAKNWVVDSGETEQVMMQPVRVSKDVVMSLYSATLDEGSGRSWTTYTTSGSMPDANSKTHE